MPGEHRGFMKDFIHDRQPHDNQSCKRTAVLRVFALIMLMVAPTGVVGQTPTLQLGRRPTREEMSLMIFPNTTNWITLQASRDLRLWYPSIHLLTTNSVIP
jgi:hypothetical protein